MVGNDKKENAEEVSVEKAASGECCGILNRLEKGHGSALHGVGSRVLSRKSYFEVI